MDLLSEISSLKKDIELLKRELDFYKMVATSSYVQKRFDAIGGTYTLNCMKPRTLNEKIIWLRENFFASCPATYYYSDKYFFKYFIERLFGKGLTPQLLGVWNDPANIDFTKLPDKFVLKRTLSGGSYEVKIVDKSADDLPKLVSAAKRWVSDRLRPPGRIIAEKFLTPDSEGYITDYKIYVTRGKVLFCKIVRMKVGSKYRSNKCVTPEFEPLDIKNNHATIKTTIQKPENWNEMINFAISVSNFFPFMRVDLYSDGKKFYAGELTDAPMQGLDPVDVKFDQKMGKQLDLPSPEEISAYNNTFYNLFPELRQNLFELKKNVNTFRIEHNGKVISDVKDLPVPPSTVMLPLDIS